MRDIAYKVVLQETVEVNSRKDFGMSCKVQPNFKDFASQIIHRQLESLDYRKAGTPLTDKCWIKF